MGRIRPRILPEWHKSISLYIIKKKSIQGYLKLLTCCKPNIWDKMWKIRVWHLSVSLSILAIGLWYRNQQYRSFVLLYRQDRYRLSYIGSYRQYICIGLYFRPYEKGSSRYAWDLWMQLKWIHKYLSQFCIGMPCNCLLKSHLVRKRMNCSFGSSWVFKWST